MPHPKDTNSKHRICFDKGEACASPLSINLWKTLDISSKIGHVPHPNNTNSKHRIWFDKGEACASHLSTNFRKH